MSHTVSDIPIEIQSAIKSIADKNGKFSGTKYKKLSDTIHSWFDENSEWITPKALFYLLKNGLNELPFCEFCHTVQLTAKQYEWSYKRDHHYCCPEHASKSTEVREKINKSWEKYGGAPFKSQDVIEKRRQTWNQKYGGNNPISDPKVLEKYRQTCLERYGVDNISKSRCLTCYPKHAFVPKKETEVADWIRSIYTGTVETSNRSLINPYELDIYIPDRKLAIEFDGMYWHSERFKEKNYHQKKSILCIEKGIRLIHVPELVWDKRTRFIKSIIKNALGLTENKIYARDTQVTEIDSLSYRIFLNENHMQGAIDSRYKYGLLYNGELISVMGFGDSRFKKNEQELHRFCSKMDWNVVGGFQKLLKHSGFHGISYVDLNFFDGSGYKEAGFEFVSYTEPSYVWLSCETGMVYSRYQTQKHKLAKLLEFFEPTLSENDNMMLNGYIKIYDSGTMKLRYN